MSNSLENVKPKDSYGDLLHISNGNGGVDGTLRRVYDGKGNATAMRISSGGVRVDGDLEVTGSIVGSTTLSDDAPEALGSANAGAALEAARGDHVHAHGNQAGGTLHAAATTGAAGFMSAADKTKLDGIASAATANSADATLLARGNHTGTQAISTVTGLQAALDAKAASSHAHAISDVTGLQESLDGKAPLASPALTGTPTAPTALTGTNTTQIATTAFVSAAINALINGAPGALDTLLELSAAMGNDPNFATTVTNALALKAPLASPALTGTPTAPTASQGNNSTQLATTAYVDAYRPTESIIVAVGDEATAITAGTAKVTFRMPYAMTLTAVRASLTTASSSGLVTVDVNESGSSILSTKLTIDQGEKTSTTAATAAVLSDTALADDAEMTIDIDGAGTGAAGLKVTLIGRRAS